MFGECPSGSSTRRLRIGRRLKTARRRCMDKGDAALWLGRNKWLGYCGGVAGCCCGCLSLPPPKIFCRKFFFFGSAGGWLVSGALPEGGVFGADRTMGAGDADGVAACGGV